MQINTPGMYLFAPFRQAKTYQPLPLLTRYSCNAFKLTTLCFCVLAYVTQSLRGWQADRYKV